MQIQIWDKGEKKCGLPTLPTTTTHLAEEPCLHKKEPNVLQFPQKETERTYFINLNIFSLFSRGGYNKSNLGTTCWVHQQMVQALYFCDLMPRD